jgi:hypothetical protein
MQSPKSDFKIINFILSIIGLNFQKHSKAITKITSFVINCAIMFFYFQQLFLRSSTTFPRPLLMKLLYFIGLFDQTVTKVTIMITYVFMLYGRTNIAVIESQLKTFDLKFKFIFVRRIDKKWMHFQTVACFSLTLMNILSFYVGHHFKNLNHEVILNVVILSILLHFWWFLILNIEVRVRKLLKITHDGKNLQEIQILVSQISKIYDDMRAKYSTLFTLLMGEF